MAPGVLRFHGRTDVDQEGRVGRRGRRWLDGGVRRAVSANRPGRRENSRRLGGRPVQRVGALPKPWNIQVINFQPGNPDIPTCSGNNLTGHLPPSFGAVPKLQTFTVSGPVAACVGSAAGTKCNPSMDDECLPDIGQLGGFLPSQLPDNLPGSVFAVTDTHVSGSLPRFGNHSQQVHEQSAVACAHGSILTDCL